ncbi:KIF-binding protein [Latimeria chalumnae]|uniref:KIF-binding protein n=1 Tax=Latimeria chalumnae TaxID=7897 RepID=UPI0006D90E31|nr:PREDICTED: KIF1-binding protein [Latimeria chalumnae]|eukprot:XP_014340477.1 PREDICTED: KIF1-binding protein [Latimeria chalumnae]
MEPVAGALRKSLGEKYQWAIALSEVESKKDPECEPYRSKYSARELLKEIKKELGQLDSEEERQKEAGWERESGGEEEGESAGCGPAQAVLLLGVIEYQLGLNHAETEELSAGEEHLLNCIRLLEPHKLSQGCVSVVIQAQNQLGILWAGRAEIEAAQMHLENAEGLYNQYMKQTGKPPLDPHEYFMAEEEKLTEQERARRFEKVYTYTLYYLAQVYKNMEMNEKASRYCHTTLQRQLEFHDYVPVEWAINAAALSQYYITEQRYMEARHCLAAANVIFSHAEEIPSETAAEENEVEIDRHEQLSQKKSEIARCWIKFCLNLLQDARKMLEDNIGELDPGRQDEMKARRKKEEEEKEEGRKNAVLFGSSDLYDVILAVEEKVSCVYPLDFTEAREIFLVGQNYISEAKEYFELDGHVTDHVEILRDHSALFKAVAFFEEDYERCCKMHKRRIDMLEPIYNELNPRFYLLICRQLQFELADTFYEMMDLKVAIATKLDELDSHTIKKINHLAQSAIRYYELFLDSLRSPDKKFPEKLESDVLRPALVAKFRIARLYGKFITSNGRKQLDNMQKSLDYYSFVVDYCHANLQATRAVETELELCEEMAGLLPARMERLRAKMSPFT